MSWWLIALLLLAAFGPVLWIMPSRRDRLLARLRSGARQRGLLVELTTLPDPGAPPEARVSAGGKLRHPTIACTAYRHPLPRAARYAPRWRLLASAADEGPVEGWSFDGTPEGDADYWRRTGELLKTLPHGMLGVEFDRNHVSLYWRERLEADQVETVLDALAAALNALADWHWSEDQRLCEAFANPDPNDD